MKPKVEVEIITNPEVVASTDFDRSIAEIHQEIDNVSSKADKWDYFAAIASGIMCGMLDVLWTGDFDFREGRKVSDEKIKDIVVRTAKLMGCEDDDLTASVAFLEKKFPLPADGNTPDFGGGLQHHLRDFAHHPTIVGLIFSLLTQFTGYSYGTDTSGKFIIVPVPERSKVFIGKDIPDKIFQGSVIWFFHLVSDIAGSSNSAAFGGGTGIPGPILSLAKEMATIPVFKNVKVGDYELSAFLSKVFNGTIFAKYDQEGKIIRDTVIQFDFRGELGATLQLGKQAIPVVANDVLVRSVYFVKRIAAELKKKEIKNFDDLIWLNWDECKPFNNPTLDRMLLVATGVFSSVDFADAVVTKKYWVSVNYVGIGRFTVAVGKETTNLLRIRNLKRIKDMYERIEQNTYSQSDDRIYARMGKDMDYDKFGLTIEQTEILYNLEYYKTKNDISKALLNNNARLKEEWLHEWWHYMEIGFPDFTGNKNLTLHLYDENELGQRIQANDPEKVWYRLALLEAMIFEPYYPLSVEKDNKGNEVPSKKYKSLQNPALGFNKQEGDKYLDKNYADKYYQAGYVKRLRRTYSKVLRELNEVLKTALTTLAITAGITIAAAVTAGILAGPIAVALVGSNFAGLSGAALSSACLAYIGGGAIAAGGFGMLGGTAAIVGGGAILGLGVGAGTGGITASVSMMGKKGTILQSAKLLTSVREVFLNDEHDIEYSNSVYEQYVNEISEIEHSLSDLKLEAETADKEKKKQLKKEIKNTEESVEAMKVAMKSLNKFKSAFETGEQFNG